MAGFGCPPRVKVRHAREGFNKRRTAAALAKAVERYERFTLHGMIPEDFTKNEENAAESASTLARRGAPRLFISDSLPPPGEVPPA
jgi:hypothetical protein